MNLLTQLWWQKESEIGEYTEWEVQLISHTPFTAGKIYTA